ncbi:HAMP domain-containing sensor histidine kinase [Streptomyces sp. NPDC046197]|uniref:sensor histidine kinase n=1 Tax=Streptomyces sp. NPDC046197 TaxID=3154337 RepID=UPI0033D71B55
MTPGGSTPVAPGGGLRARMRRMPIVLRLVLTVALAMSVVLCGAAALVYWRVQYALDRQLDEDLTAYQHSLAMAVRTGGQLPAAPTGSTYQILDAGGRVLQAGEAARGRQLLTAAEFEDVTAGRTVRRDQGALLPISPDPLRLEATRVRRRGTTVVAVAAVARGHRDEALRELLGQLGLASGLTLLAASYVGYRTARAALGPVERYRHGAATLADGAQGLRLPVPADRDDELTRLGHTLNRMLDHLEASTERERRFIADASHELRTPLTLLRAELDLALHRPRTSEELTATLRAVDTEVHRLIDLSNALLDLEQLGSGEQIRRTSVDVADLVHTATDRHRKAAARDGRALLLAVVPAAVRVDPRWVEPAIANLVDNALRHGHGEVRVQAEATEGRLRLSVTDQGPGFPPTFLSKAFDRFARAEASRTSPGSGLGLALVAAVAASHDGTAHAANTGHGAKVTLDIPC